MCLHAKFCCTGARQGSTRAGEAVGNSAAPTGCTAEIKQATGSTDAKAAVNAGEAAYQTPPTPTSVSLTFLVNLALEQRAAAFGNLEVTPARIFLALLSLAHQVGQGREMPGRSKRCLG